MNWETYLEPKITIAMEQRIVDDPLETDWMASLHDKAVAFLGTQDIDITPIQCGRHTHFFCIATKAVIEGNTLSIDELVDVATRIEAFYDDVAELKRQWREEDSR